MYIVINANMSSLKCFCFINITYFLLNFRSMFIMKYLTYCERAIKNGIPYCTVYSVR